MLEIGIGGLKALNNDASFQKIEALHNDIKNKKMEFEDNKTEEGLQQFESYFINMMFKEMRKSVPKFDSYLTGGREEKMFQEMMDEKMSEEMAKNGGLGFTAMLKEDLISRNLLKDSKGKGEAKDETATI